jgi:hypothetical protein
MNNARKIQNFILNLFFMLFFTVAFSQNQQTKPTRLSALDAFSKGNFEVAFKQFSELSVGFPRDPLYKYYCGVCLVKLERDPVKASSLLKGAQQESAAIRTIPNDVTFYLGRALQMEGKFSEAISSFKKFTDLAGKKTAKEALTPQYIQQCTEKKGAVAVVNTSEKEIVRKDKIPQVIDEKAVLPEKVKNDGSDTIIKKVEPPSEEYINLLNEALNYQFAADSLMKLADVYRKQLEKVSPTEKTDLKTGISEIEKLSVFNQKKADEILIKANNYSGGKSAREILKEKRIKSDSVSFVRESRPAITPTGTGIIKDSAEIKNDGTLIAVKTQKTISERLKDTVSQLPAREKELAQIKQADIYSVFEIAEKPLYRADEKVQVNNEVEAGLIYRIQVAVFKNPVSPAYFKGITPVYGFKNDGSEVTIYYAGMFRKSADASKALIKVKSAGFKDAFVVALFEKKIISPERAGILEKEWGNKPLLGTNDRKNPDVIQDTVPPTLIFRVEVIRVLKPLTIEQSDNIRKLAGNRGLDIIKIPSGQTIYLIGKFLTFESAAEYTDLLTRNGQKEAKVTAYLGNREIPVETARQLFEKFE